MSKTGNCILSFGLLLLFCLVTADNLYAQTSQVTVVDIRDKYTWGSIYLTYSPICDMTTVLSKQDSFDKIYRSEFGAIAAALRNFLISHRSPSMRDGIAFIQLNLITNEAGFLKAGEFNGAIHKIPWSQYDVEMIARLCDRFLTAGTTFVSIYRILSNPNTSLAIGWQEVQKIMQLDSLREYLPDAKISLILIRYRLLLKEKSVELKKMQEDKDPLAKTLLKFKNEVDKTIYDVIFPPQKAMQSPKKKTDDEHKPRKEPDYPPLIDKTRVGPPNPSEKAEFEDLALTFYFSTYEDFFKENLLKPYDSDPYDRLKVLPIPNSIIELFESPKLKGEPVGAPISPVPDIKKHVPNQN